MTEPANSANPPANSAVVALSLFNSFPVGSLLDNQFVIEHDEMLVQYELLAPITAGQPALKSPARLCLDAATQAREKAIKAVEYAAAGHNVLPLWRKALELIDDAIGQAGTSLAQVNSFTDYDQPFLQANWNSITRDLLYARGKIRDEIQRLILPAGRTAPDNAGAQASLAQALAVAGRLNSFDQAALLRQLAATVLTTPSNDETEINRLDEAAKQGWEAATDLMFQATELYATAATNGSDPNP